MMATYLSSYPNSITEGSGLISLLSTIEAIPWSILTEEQIQDIERAYGIRSGFKTLSTGFLTSSEDARTRILSTIFSQKWKRLWDAYALEYNILDAYSLTESGKRETDRISHDTNTYGRAVNEQGSDTGTVDNVGSDNGGTTDSVYGFNSVDAVPSETGTNHNASTAKETRNLATSRNITNSGQDEKDVVGNDVEEYSYTKKGNIGYNTPQELIRQNIELWKIPFFEVVFSDIDSFITILVYDI